MEETLALMVGRWIMRGEHQIITETLDQSKLVTYDLQFENKLQVMNRSIETIMGVMQGEKYEK